MAALSQAFAKQLDTTVQTLPSLPPRERERAISEVLRDLRPHAQRWSTRICQRNGDMTCSHSDDVVSESLMAIWTALRAVADGKRQIGNVYGYLYTSAVFASTKYFQSAAVTGLAGQTVWVRTQRQLSYLSEQITRTVQRPATAAEIADAFNRQTRERRKHPKKDRVLTVSEVRSWMAERDGTVHRKPSRGALAA